jgi:hypothetical protein
MLNLLLARPVEMGMGLGIIRIDAQAIGATSPRAPASSAKARSSLSTDVEAADAGCQRRAHRRVLPTPEKTTRLVFRRLDHCSNSPPETMSKPCRARRERGWPG